MKNLINKRTIILALAILFAGVAVVFILVRNEIDTVNKFSKSGSFDVEASLVKRSINEVDGLIELADKEKAIVMEIKNKEELVKLGALFDRAYQNDIVIFLPNQTIIYDASTKTIRDISSESFYEEVTK